MLSHHHSQCCEPINHDNQTTGKNVEVVEGEGRAKLSHEDFSPRCRCRFPLHSSSPALAYDPTRNLMPIQEPSPGQLLISGTTRLSPSCLKLKQLLCFIFYDAGGNEPYGTRADLGPPQAHAALKSYSTHMHQWGCDAVLTAKLRETTGKPPLTRKALQKAGNKGYTFLWLASF